MSDPNPEWWQAVSPFLDQALDMSEDERAVWLATLRNDAPDLAARLEALLQEHHVLGQERFLEDSPAIFQDRASPAGSRVGAYTLLTPLGEGGMGTVWLAERSDGEFQHKVAVKLLDAARRRPGWRVRFLRERQLLAALDHPSIVHVVDAGRTDDGQPYLIMEYVDGKPIDVYAAPLAVRDRLKLFLQVCDGVAHAHRRLILHRDLKPSNILVDATGLPKLLDFGIARLLDETGDPTETIERVLTPAYASPEQFRGAAHTTATDVYSLGAVLYKVLTGRSPHESDTRTSQALDVIAGTKEIPAATRLNPDLPSDIDYILRTALRREADERYASVEAFAGDVRAVLESRPVEARAGDTWYRARKFVRRHWVPVLAAALVAASLSVGAYIANRERVIAQRRFTDVRQLSSTLFDIDLQVRQLTGSSKARQLIVDTSLEYLRRLTGDAGNDPDLALEVGNAYMRVARVQGVPTSPNLGQMDRAEENLLVADRFVQSVVARQPTNRVALLRSAQIASDRMILARFTGRADDARALASQSAAWLGKLNPGKGDEPLVQEILATYLNVALQFLRDERFDDALKLADRGIQIGRSFGVESYIGNFFWLKSDLFRGQGALDAALDAARESARMLDPGADKVGQGLRTMSFVLALDYEGKILGQDNSISMGLFEQAAATFSRSFDIIDDFVHRDRNDQLSRNRLADAGVNLGDALRHFDNRRSLEIYDHTLRHLAEVTENSAFRRFEVSALAGSTYSLRSLGRPGEARQRLDAAFERLKQLKLYPAEKVSPGSEAEDGLRARAEYEAGEGDLTRAIARYDEILRLTGAAKARPEATLADAVDRSNLYRAKAALHRRAGQPDAASALEARSRDLWQHWDRKLPNNTFVHRQLEAANPQ